MAETPIAKTVAVSGGDLPAALQAFVRSVLENDDIDAVLAAQHLPVDGATAAVMPVLVSDPEQLTGVDLLSPAFPMNTAKMVSRLSRSPMNRTVAVFLRPCEVRAFIELVKLRQGRPDELVIIGTDCLGAFGNRDYARLAADGGDTLTRRFVAAALDNGTQPPALDGTDVMKACKACEHPVPEGVDIRLGLWGVNTDTEILAEALTPKGQSLLNAMGLTDAAVPADRRTAVDALVAARTAFRDQMFADTEDAVKDLQRLTAYLAGCVNCYNCRVACPVCYCRECVFSTDVFDHEPIQYLHWAHRKGRIKMPTDTTFYHLTRLAHMSTACVGCGQCSNACPNDIPVMEIFRTVAHHTQSAFDYEAGGRLDASPPLTEFREHEFEDVVGIETRQQGAAT